MSFIGAVGDAKNDADQSLQLSTEAKLKAENLANVCVNKYRD